MRMMWLGLAVAAMAWAAWGQESQRAGIVPVSSPATMPATEGRR